jgi:hypothetical protein
MVPIERIDGAILAIRGRKVMLDADLAALYGVSTKRMNEQVRRNAARFPADFMFQLTLEEYATLKVANCDLRRRYEPVAICGRWRRAYSVLRNASSLPR